MKIIIFLFFIFSNFSCRQSIDLKDEKNYVLIRTDSFEHVISKKIFVNKYDTSMKISILYSYGDGIMSGKSFLKGQLMDGVTVVYGVDGSVLDSEFYKNGMKEGLQKEYYPNGKIEKTELYKNGTLGIVENFDSSGNKIEQ